MPSRKVDKAVTGVEPLTISVMLGATIPTKEYGNIRPSVEIKNIRLDYPVEPQLKQALEAAGKAWLAIDDEIEHRVMDMLSVDAGSAETPTLRDRVAKLESWQILVRKNTKTIADEVKRHKGLLETKKRGARKLEPMGDRIREADGQG